MTTPPVMSITDEQIAELEARASARLQGINSFLVKQSLVLALITRLREAEADAKRYRWLVNNWRVQEVIDFVLGDDSETVEAYGQLIDAATEQTK